jgi:hypothetical protein
MTYTIKTNEKQRTATIRVYEGSELIAKYRTMPFSKEDFITVSHWSESDIKNFLRFENGSYYLVK